MISRKQYRTLVAIGTAIIMLQIVCTAILCRQMARTRQAIEAQPIFSRTEASIPAPAIEIAPQPTVEAAPAAKPMSETSQIQLHIEESPKADQTPPESGSPK